jgi:hypothetical protein
MKQALQNHIGLVNVKLRKLAENTDSLTFDRYV